MNTIHFNMDAPSNDEPVAAAHSPAMGHSADGDGVLFMMTSKFLASRRPYRLGNAVLMAGSSHGLVLTPDLRPALCDNGASKGTSCSRTLEGAIPGTRKLEDAGDISLGSDGASLESLGSYLFALERFGVDSSEVVLRRMKHTPNLPMAMVFSEASESALHR